jgi:L-ascorbate metabolism protein UlaG (beta-lactamase superfamily)
VQLALRKDDALLADIERARAGGRRGLWWLGQSGFLLHADGRTVLMDPYLSDSLTLKYAGTDKPHIRMTERVVDPARLAGIDLVTVSHAHTDHCDADTLRPVLDANPDARLVVGRANHALVLERLGGYGDRVMPIDVGEVVTHAGVQVEAVPAAHDTVERDEHGWHRFLGYVVTVGPLVVYHSGDTRWHAGLPAALAGRSIDVALVPINGSRPERRVAGNMNGEEAAQLAREVGARLAVPHHFDMFTFNTEPPDLFEATCARLGQPFRTLRQGEGIDLTGSKLETRN